MKISIIALVAFTVNSWINLCLAQSNQPELCAIAGKIIGEQSIDLSFESRMVGKCNVAIDHSILPKELRADPGEYQCDFGKMVILTEDMFFAENVRYAVQIEKLRMRGTRKIIKYKIVQFFHNTKNFAGNRWAADVGFGPATIGGFYSPPSPGSNHNGVFGINAGLGFGVPLFNGNVNYGSTWLGNP